MSSKRDASAFADDLLCATIDQWARDGSHEPLLLELLEHIHRDHGQYTTLAGLSVSVLDAIRIVDALHKDNAALKARLKKLTHE